ncbi:MAG: hypothetical protein ABR518_01170, partial [Actinomycetota bacterium]
ILVFGTYLKEQGLLDDEKIEAIRTELKEEVDREVQDAWDAPDPTPDTATVHVFADSKPTGAAGDRSNEKADAMETTGGEATPADAPAGGGE